MIDLNRCGVHFVLQNIFLNMKSILRLLSFGLACVPLYVPNASSQPLRLDITGGQFAPIPVAVADFTA